MPNSQLSVKWLSPREKAVAIDALKENSQGAGNLTFRFVLFPSANCLIPLLTPSLTSLAHLGGTKFGECPDSALNPHPRTSPDTPATNPLFLTHREAFCDPRTYIYFLFSACMNIPNVSVPFLRSRVFEGGGLTSSSVSSLQGGVTSFGNLGECTTHTL